MQILETLKNYIAVDSSDAHGTGEIAEYLVREATEYGLEAKIYSETSAGAVQANVVITQRGAWEKEYAGDALFVSGLETENPGDYSQWIRNGANPFNASIVGDAVFGLGVHAKADVVAKLAALMESENIHASQTKNRLRPVFVGTFGRERATGVRRLIRKKIFSPQMAFVGAPTQLHWGHKSLGYAKIDVRIPYAAEEKKYRQDHDLLELGQTQSKIFLRDTDRGAELDANPIIKMIEYLSQLPDGIAVMSIEGGASADTEPNSSFLEIDVIGGLANGVAGNLKKISTIIRELSAELMAVRDEDFHPPYSRLVLGQVRTFTDEIVFSGVCRLVPAAGKGHYELWIEKLRQAVEKSGAKVNIEAYMPPYSGSRSATLNNILKSVSSDVSISDEAFAVPVCSGASVFAMLGCESVIFGPGEFSDKQQLAMNFVRLSEIDKAKEVYKQIMTKI